MIKAFEDMDKILKDYGLLDFQAFDKLEKYMNGILEWTEKVNITNIKEENEFIAKHYIDSIAIIGSEEFKKADTIIDIGTGGGFPGIPLAILYPQKKFMLVDSLNKRVKIIKELIDEIGIKNVEVVHGRAEELARKEDMRETYDLCVSRAVANLRSLVELCIPFVKEKGCFIAYKGPGVFEELKDATKAIKTLGGEVLRVEDGNLGKENEHKLLFIRKNRKTSIKYPRKPGEPIKNPL